MSLPKIAHSTFALTLPFSKTKIKYRQFLVKEEKILLTAASSQDQESMLGAIKQVLQNCLVSPSKLDVGSLTTIDIEYYFTRLRAASVNNIIELSFKDEEDEKRYTFEIDLNEIEPSGEMPPILSPIDLDGNNGIMLTPPTLDMAIKMVENGVDLKTDPYALIRECIVQIFDKEQTFEKSEASKEELDAWIETFPPAAKRQIEEFFLNLPQLKYIYTYKNQLEHERTITLAGLADFFWLG